MYDYNAIVIQAGSAFGPTFIPAEDGDWRKLLSRRRQVRQLPATDLTTLPRCQYPDGFGNYVFQGTEMWTSYPTF